MHSFAPTVILGALVGQTFGTVHHMFSGIFSGTDIYAIEFDDETNTLTLANNIISNAASSKWVAIDVHISLSCLSMAILTQKFQERKQNLYVTNGAQYDSYAITNSTGLAYSSSVYMDSNCMSISGLNKSNKLTHSLKVATLTTSSPRHHHLGPFSEHPTVPAAQEM